ncbi:unnamed protein product [Chrysoparadoxa australica]
MFAEESDPPVTPRTGVGAIDCRDCIPDPHFGSKSIRDLYERSKDTAGKYSVPVLWDLKEGCIVNNESSEIVDMFNSAFNGIAKNPALDLQPAETVAAANDVNEWIYANINNGVYRCGFARSQEAYDRAFADLYRSLDKCEQILSKQRYIAGDVFTIADIRLFVTLVRFDEVYVVYFKCNKKRISDYPNLHNYLRELYQMPALQETTNMAHIKNHYFTSHPELNILSIVPGGPGALEDLLLPHNRAKA